MPRSACDSAHRTPYYVRLLVPFRQRWSFPKPYRWPRLHHFYDGRDILIIIAEQDDAEAVEEGSFLDIIIFFVIDVHCLDVLVAALAAATLPWIYAATEDKTSWWSLPLDSQPPKTSCWSRSFDPVYFTNMTLTILPGINRSHHWYFTYSKRNCEGWAEMRMSRCSRSPLKSHYG